MRAIEIPCPSCHRPPGARCAVEASGRSLRGHPADSVVYCRSRARAAHRETVRGGDILGRVLPPPGVRRPEIDATGAPGSAAGSPGSPGPRPGPGACLTDVTGGTWPAPATTTRPGDDAPSLAAGPAVRVRLDMIVDVRYGDGRLAIPAGDPGMVVLDVARTMVHGIARTRPGWWIRAGLTRDKSWATRWDRVNHGDLSSLRRSVRIRLGFIADLAPTQPRHAIDTWSMARHAHEVVAVVARLLVPDVVSLHPGWRLTIVPVDGSRVAARRDAQEARRRARVVSRGEVAGGQQEEVAGRREEVDRFQDATERARRAALGGPASVDAGSRGGLLASCPMSAAEILDLVARTRRNMETAWARTRQIGARAMRSRATQTRRGSATTGDGDAGASECERATRAGLRDESEQGQHTRITRIMRSTRR